MLKRLTALFLLICVCFLSTSCAVLEWIRGEMHGDLRYVETGILEYHGEKYYSADTVLDLWVKGDDIEIAWKYNFPFSGRLSYYADNAEDPLYIFYGYDYAYDVFLSEDFDYRNKTFILDQTDVEVNLYDAFSKVDYELPEDYLGNYGFELYMEEYPRLTINAQCSWSDGKWYCIRNGKNYLLSDNFVKILKENGILPIDSDNRTPTEGLEGVNKFRPDYGLGACQNLKGEISVALFYMDDLESKWTRDEILDFEEKYLEKAFEFLEKEAKKYGAALNFEIQKSFSGLYYDDDVIVNINEEGYATTDVLEQAAKEIGYASDTKMIEALKAEYGTEEVICLNVFNKNGVAYALNPRRGSDAKADEHSIVFGKEGAYIPSDVVLTTLCLYGAESLKNTMWRRYLASPYKKDIMFTMGGNLSESEISELTAFYIGWTDKIPDVMLDENWWKYEE